MKIFEAMEAERLKRVPPRPRFAHVEASCDMAAARDMPDQFQWKYKIQLHCFFTGPSSASMEIEKQARRLISKEVYGEICDDMHELLRILHEEQYRAPDDPAMQVIATMLSKMLDESN